MKLSRASVLAYALPIVMILVLAILLSVTLSRLAAIQHNMRDNVNANMVWVIYQAHIESLMLANALQHAQHTDQLHSPELTHRYHMLLSRINVLNDGPQSRALDNINVSDPLLGQSHAIAALLHHALEANSPTLATSVVLEQLEAFTLSLLQAANQAMVAQWEEAGSKVDRYRNAVLTVIFLMIGIWIGSAFISVQLLFTLKRAREHEASKQRGIELQKQLENERKISDLYRSFGSMVSHQFRTPLAIIDATMQRLIRAHKRMDTTEIIYRASKAREAAQRLNHLINTILKADRFMEQLQVTMHAHSLAQLAQQAITEKKIVTPCREMQFQDDTPPDTLVLCDPVLTSHIISNLLSNAIKYSAHTKPISVRVYQDANWICCAVRDWGIGIAAADIEQVFKRYFRAKATTDVVGTGIGLYIALELTTLQHGEILVHSELGAGSTFLLRLPTLSHHSSFGALEGNH